MAAYLSITGLISLDVNAKTRKKYEELKSKYYNDLDNYEKDMPEKVILLELMMYYMETDETLTLKQRAEINIGKIMKFSNECNDKRYSALADSILFIVGTNEERMKKYDDFKNKYPQHPAIPYVELQQVARYSIIKEYQKCIEETENLIKKYGNIEGPSGYKMIVDFYELLFDCYFDMNDKANAELYMQKIESECPSYVGLYRIKEQITRIGKDPFDIFTEESEEVEVNE